MELKCRMAEIRYSKRMTQTDLFEKTGIAVSMISAYENNLQFPNTYTLWKLAKALDCKVDDLYEEV